MDWRNRIGLDGSYFFGVSGIEVTLPTCRSTLASRGCWTGRSADLDAPGGGGPGRSSRRALVRPDRLVEALLVVALGRWPGDRAGRGGHGVSGGLLVVLLRRALDSGRSSGSAIGPAAASFLVGPLGDRGRFGVLAGLGAVATGSSCPRPGEPGAG